MTSTVLRRGSISVRVTFSCVTVIFLMVLAYLFFLTFLGHFSAILFHTLVVRDGLPLRMVPWKIPSRETIPVHGDIEKV